MVLQQTTKGMLARLAFGSVLAFFPHEANSPEMIPGKNLPPGLEDLTLYLFLQEHHDSFHLTDNYPPLNDSIGNCQFGIYRELETLYKERKISGVFFEGVQVKEDLTAIVESYYPSVELLQEKRSELAVADDAKLKALFMLPDDNGDEAVTLFPLLYGNLPDLLVTGWEDNSSKLPNHLEYKIISWRYNMLYDNQHRTPREEIEFQKVAKEKTAMDKMIGQDRTRQAYENAFSQEQIMLDAHPDLPHGYAVVVGLSHAHEVSLHGSAYADITASPSYPNAKIYECRNSFEIISSFLFLN